MTLAIGVDVGGTKVAAGVVDEDGQIIAKLKRSTPAASPARTEQVIADAVTELLGQGEVPAIGIGAAGFVDSARATILFAPNLAWRDEPLKQRVEERLGREVVVENDANATAWAEARFGAARGYRDLMLVALGTGIGAAILIGGELYRGRWGMAGEPGHIRVVPDGRLCGCGNRGCWEQYCSGNALVAEAREFARRTAARRAPPGCGRARPPSPSGRGRARRQSRWRRRCRCPGRPASGRGTRARVDLFSLAMIWPSSSTTPAATFVPPTSTPMARVTDRLPRDLTHRSVAVKPRAVRPNGFALGSS